MRKTKEILRLKFEGDLGNHKIGRALGVSASTVWDTVARFQAAGLGWPLPSDLGETELEARLYRRRGGPGANPERLPDWARVQRELQHKHVTLRLLWEEYKAESPDGYQYSWFCEGFREWRKAVDLVMRQEHKAGEKVFIDWAGDTIPLVEPETGEVRPCYLFLAVLGASNYTYAEPSLVLSTHLPPARDMTDRLLDVLALLPEAPPFLEPNQAVFAQIAAALSDSSATRWRS